MYWARGRAWWGTALCYTWSGDKGTLVQFQVDHGGVLDGARPVLVWETSIFFCKMGHGGVLGGARPMLGLLSSDPTSGSNHKGTSRSSTSSSILQWLV
ncbi:hypothetical protein L1987_60545 [Smallanthus sonchifolius]|uniref:Uncharacterized protein n=1 Tax=Smallanthus sonchifolius TaxID=185202 RepID=A0ACB9D8C0_9ASTR|nr:hypothetical protein L1987_60545 [Smallanthus sonchifolius]